MCTEQGRYSESLAHYEMALQVRENSPGTPPQRIGLVLNNIANVRRRMGAFEEALGSVDRAREFLEPVGGHSLACAYGTRGLIFRDWGRDEEAVEWFRKSSAEHEKQPSPNLETLSEELENEAAALERLGRWEEAASARDRLESVRASMAQIQPLEHKFGEMKLPLEGAVLVELNFGSRPGSRYGKSDAAKLERELSDVMEAEGAGYCAGRITIPETTTFLLYGTDAEAMFQKVQPLILQQPMCAGARVTVRQGNRHREVLFPEAVM